MHIFFLSNYFPGDLGPLARALAAAPENEVLFASNRQRKGYTLPGVRQVRLKSAALFGDAPPTVSHLWEEALRRGSSGLRSLLALRQSWGAPDIIFATLAGGAAFFAPQAFPDSFLVTYTETGLKNFSLLPPEGRAAWLLLQSSLFLQGGLCFAWSERQRRLFPRQLRGDIHLVAPCVDTEVFSRAAAQPWFAGEAAGGAAGAARLLTLDATGLDGEALAALLRLGHAVLRAHTDCHVVMLTENGRLREALEAAAATGSADCRARFAAYNSLPFERYRDLLAASALVVSPGHGDAAERAMLEAMSCETLLMARSATANFLRPDVNMLELPEAPLDTILALLVPRPRDSAPTPQGRSARRTVLTQFSEAVVVPRHLAEVMRAYAAWKKERGA